jgi:hypothetical protein
MTTTNPASPAVQRDATQALDIEALFPADPELMVSPGGDKRGLQELQRAARDRRSELAARQT